MSTDHSRLLIKIASLYYEHNMTQLEVAERLRLSRQKVQRLLSQAHDEGIVRINVYPVTGVFSDLEEALEQKFGLREAVVVETRNYDDPSAITREIGAGAAGYLLRVAQLHDNIVTSWGSSLLGMINAISAGLPKRVSDGMVIQGLGGIADPTNEVHAADLTRRLAKLLGAKAVLLPAPGVAGSSEARDAFHSDPYVAEALKKARAANLAFIGIGAPRQDSILVQKGNIVSWAELTELMERGVVGDIALRYFDEYGQVVSSDLDERVIGLTLDEIKQIDHVVGVAGGSVKLKAIRGALQGKLVDVLITDHVTAQKLSGVV